MKKAIDFILRNAAWFAVGLTAILLLSPGQAEIRTILLISAVECLALALSGLAVYVYTHLDFTSMSINSNLGNIFLGVHVCVGLSVLGVYIAQFAN